MESRCVALMEFGAEPISRTEVEVRLGRLRNGKDEGHRRDDKRLR